MNNVRTWISRVSAIALVAASVSASAGILAPDFLVHKASVSIKTSEQSLEGIERETVKTKQVINYLMGRLDLDQKNEKDENLGLVTGCDVNSGVVELAVYDKKLKVIKPLSSRLIFDIEGAVTELNNKGELKKSDIIASLEDLGDLYFISLTGDVKYGKIGNKVVKDGLPTWDKDTICASNFKTKSLTGASEPGGLGFLSDSILMSGKINAGGAQFGFNDFIPAPSVSITKDNGIADDILLMPGDISYVITVTNTGNVTLTDVVVSDDQLLGLPGGIEVLVCGDDLGGGVGDFDGTLIPGEDVVCVGDRVVDEAEFLALCEIDPIGDGFIRNVATVTSDQTNIQGTANVTFLDCDWVPNPILDELSIVKTADVDFAGVGDTINYLITVTNVGNVDLFNVLVEDNFAGVSNPVCIASDLIAGASTTCTANLTVSPEIGAAVCLDDEGLLRNVATVIADDAAVGGNPTSTFATDEIVELNDCVVINP